MINQSSSEAATLPDLTNPWLGIFFLCFFLLGEYESMVEYGPVIGILEAFWVCSFSMVLASFGCSAGRPNWVATAMISVSTGHTLWIVDSFTLLFNGSRLGSLGVADYGGVDGVTLSSFLAVSHHLWFMAACARHLRGVRTQLTLGHFASSYVWVSLVSLLTLWINPVKCVMYKGTCILANVNMALEWWGAEFCDFCHWYDRDRGGSGLARWLWSNFLYSGVFNGALFGLLWLAVNYKAERPETARGKDKKKK